MRSQHTFKKGYCSSLFMKKSFFVMLLISTAKGTVSIESQINATIFGAWFITNEYGPEYQSFKQI